MLIGITHDINKVQIIREPRVLKVGIGISKGRAVYVYLKDRRWMIRVGKFDKEKLAMVTVNGPDGQPGFATKQEAQSWFSANKESIAISNRPQKIPFFTFTKRIIREVKGKPEESFEPDFDAIEAHGEMPREIDIVFMAENPLFQQYQAWSATELKCSGDGVLAQRLIQLGNKDWPGWTEAEAAKQKTFPVIECWVSGLCPIAEKGECKPTSVLTFQLANDIRVGATSYFTTTSIRSAIQLASSLASIRALAERVGAGISNTPLKLVLAPFRTNHDNKPATQYGVSLELRSQDVKKLRQLLAESAWKPGTRLLNAAEEPAEIPAEITPEAMTAEFTDEPQFEDDAADPVKQEPMAAATQEKTSALAEKIRGKQTPLDPRLSTAAQKDSSNFLGVGSAPKDPAAPAPADAPLNPWPLRTRDTYAMKLGTDNYLAMLGKLGFKSDEEVNPQNYKKVWDAMSAAVAAMPKESTTPPAESSDLF